VNKEIIINHLLKPPCTENRDFSCLNCALRFTHLCEDNELHTTRRTIIKDNISANSKGLDFISRDRCQITVLKEELQTIRKEI